MFPDNVHTFRFKDAALRSDTGKLPALSNAGAMMRQP
jgi:hypothetical protein